jgi:hypothetical protein
MAGEALKVAFATHLNASVWVNVDTVVAVSGPWFGQYDKLAMLDLYLQGGGNVAIVDSPEARTLLRVPQVDA